MRECFRCGEEFDERSFLVKIKGTNTTCGSSLCKKCLKEDGIVEIIPVKELKGKVKKQ